MSAVGQGKYRRSEDAGRVDLGARVDRVAAATSCASARRALDVAKLAGTMQRHMSWRAPARLPTRANPTSLRQPRRRDHRRGQAHLGSLADVVLVEDLTSLIRVPDVLERLCRVAAGLAKQDLVASGVLRVGREARVSSPSEAG